MHPGLTSHWWRLPRCSTEDRTSCAWLPPSGRSTPIPRGRASSWPTPSVRWPRAFLSCPAASASSKGVSQRPSSRRSASLDRPGSRPDLPFRELLDCYRGGLDILAGPASAIAPGAGSRADGHKERGIDGIGCGETGHVDVPSGALTRPGSGADRPASALCLVGWCTLA